MIPVAQAKKDLMYNENLKNVIDVLKFIASAEFSRVSARVPQEDIFRKEAIKCCRLLPSEAKKDSFFAGNGQKREAFLLVCSDEGFLGGVNTRIVNAAISKGLRHGARVLVLGEKGAKLLRDAGMRPKVFPVIPSSIDMKNIIAISDYIMNLYLKNEIGAFNVAYVQFKSFTSHQMQVSRILPCEKAGSYIRDKQDVDAIIAPDSVKVTEFVAKLWVRSGLNNIFWSSKLSEWATKVMHLENSSEELKDITTVLKHRYFKSVHALNDKVIREIFATRAITMA
ncbi:MAG: F0F1 ATP synthase subunit gamma [Candidatus Omnitrophota bacterium]